MERRAHDIVEIVKRISSQQVAAYGERVAEAELLRHGWVTANINTSIKNAADFDIFARKGKSAVNIRVKTCGPGEEAFQFSFRPGQGIKLNDLGNADFTVLVSMGSSRDKDRFHVVPTRSVRASIDAFRTSALRKRLRDGRPLKDIGLWTLRLADLRSGENRPNYGFEKKWKRYLANWGLLEAKMNRKVGRA